MAPPTIAHALWHPAKQSVLPACMASESMPAFLQHLSRHVDLRQKRFWDGGIIPVTVLLIVGATLGWVAYEQYWQAQEAEFRLLEAHARNADAQVARALGKIERLLDQIADAGLKNRAFQGKAFTAVLDRYRDDVPELGTLLVTDAGGRIRAATDTALVGRDIAGEPWFAAQRGHGQRPKLFMSRPDRRLLGVTAVAFTLPIVGAERRFRGIAGVTIGFRFFADILAAINPDDSASMTVIYNHDGDMLFRRADPEKFFGFNMIETSTVYYPHLNAGKPTTRHVGPSAIDGKARLFVVRDVGDTGLSLIVSRRRDEVLATWQRNVAIYALIFIFTAVVVTTLTIVAARRKRELLKGKVFTDQLIATANVMVLGLDAAGRITIFNEAAERICGYRRAEVLGRDWYELAVPPEVSPRVGEMFRKFQDGGALPHTVEYAVRNKAGQQRFVSWQNSVIEEPRAAISFGIDVTERNLLEAERERFVAMVSHEFRTPLATIDGAVQHLVMDAGSVDAATRKRYGKIQKAADRLTSLMDSYVLQERLGRGGPGLELEPVPTLSLLHDLQASSAALAADHLVTVDDGDRPETVLCDAALMRLALRVLADNAVKYTPPGSEVRLSCRRAQDHGVEFRVRDNGPGIHDDELPRLFDKFFRGRGAMQQSGSGIGLYLARSVVASHGGSLTAHNIPGGGAEFRVWLPDFVGAAVDSRLL